MEWFKFYNNKWLSDLAIISLEPVDRLCFITLLCVTSSRDVRDGCVTQYHEHRILTLTHLSQSDYGKGVGFTKRLQEVGLIDVIDEQTIQLKNFEKRQNSMLSPAERAKKYRDKKKVTNVTNKSDERNAREDKIREDKIRDTTAVDDGFNSFWKCYPRKIGKSNAGRAWQKLKPPLDVVLEALEVQKQCDQWQRDNGKFIPHPSTWLNGKRWEDEIETIEVINLDK